jgi:hypothetical protein
MTPEPEEHDESEDIDESEDEAEEEEETPQALIATLADLGRYLPEGLRKGFGGRPCWFIRQEDEELVEIFDRLPEDPMPRGRAHELLRALRGFAEDNSDGLQELLGIAGGIVYGFHGDASLEQVTEAFEDDGFFVWSGVLSGGVITLPEA